MRNQELGLKTQRQVFVTRYCQTSAHSSFPFMNGKQTSNLSDSFGFLKQRIDNVKNNSPNGIGGDAKFLSKYPRITEGILLFYC